MSTATQQDLDNLIIPELSAAAIKAWIDSLPDEVVVGQDGSDRCLVTTYLQRNLAPLPGRGGYVRTGTEFILLYACSGMAYRPSRRLELSDELRAIVDEFDGLELGSNSLTAAEARRFESLKVEDPA